MQGESGIVAQVEVEGKKAFDRAAHCRALASMAGKAGTRADKRKAGRAGTGESKRRGGGVYYSELRRRRGSGRTTFAKCGCVRHNGGKFERRQDGYCAVCRRAAIESGVLPRPVWEV